MIATVLISNVVTLNPTCANLVKNLSTETLYTYHKTSTRNRIIWIFIDQTQDWYEKDWFKSHDLCYN